MRRTTFIIIGCISVLIGLFVSKYYSTISADWFWICFVIAPFTLNKYFRVIFVIVLFFLLGIYRGGVVQLNYQELVRNFGAKTTITGIVLEDATYSYNKQLETTVKLGTINGQETSGTITIRSIDSSAIYRNDVVEVTGKLQPTKGGKQGSISYADVSIIHRADNKIDELRRSYISGMQNALPEPAASFGTGLLVGQRDLLPDDVTTALQIAGLTHIVAVSGYNLTIIINAVKRASRWLSRFQTIFISSALLYVFLLITGFSPSIVRASLVAGIGLATWYFGRTIRPLLLIVFVAAATGLYNPYYVWGDIGWYLSFLAFFGILIIAPLIGQVILKKQNMLPMIAIESFSAQIMTIPLILFIFSKLSVVGFLSNIVIVPLVPLAMLVSFVAGIGGILVPLYAGWIALPARIILNSMLNIAGWFSRWPHALELVSISAFTMMGMYAVLLIVIMALKKRSQSVIIEEIVT